jgi:hypothetical protein
MAVINNCDVYLTDGRTIEDTSVLFKDNGYIRTGKDRTYNYYPPHMVKAIQTTHE